ncbi:IS701 family transposase [Streptomyces sp. NPDC001339]|uniref:IS701 family transposase n=1 Tax=Streptomyces sp. NPDC001339 TaxID=3364563 RepID=UPI0036959170
MFSVLRRSDQRKKAETYVRGLLATEGRKSIRNIATLHGDAAAEQSLHHFIGSSTWDWQPMRKALARFMEQAVPQHAWVVQSLAITKAGTQSVGVARQFVPDLGKVMNSQLTFGAWFASETVTAPVGWRMFLPGSWLDDAKQRARAEIPEGTGEATPLQCAIAAGLEPAQEWGVPVRPVVLDTEVSEPAVVVRSFAPAGVPVLMRVGERTRLVLADPALPGSGRGSLTARRILDSVKGLARPVEWTHPSTGGARRVSLAAAVPVRLAESGSGTQLPWRGRRGLLLGEWHDLRRGPSRIWLADLPEDEATGGVSTSSTGSLLRLTKLAARVGHDAEQVGDRVGLRDFEGRSFPGWHRHMTLASVAHTVATLEKGTEKVCGGVPPRGKPCGRDRRRPNNGALAGSCQGH